MPRKVFFIILTTLTLISFTLHARVTSAQEGDNPFDFKRAYEDFVFTYDQYRSQHSDYELARSQYIQSKTLAAKANAQTQTYEMLVARDEMLKSYLTMLRMRLGEAVGIAVDKRDLLYSKIDTEVKWYDDHKNSLSSAATLEDQIRDSDKAKARYESITVKIFYEILTHISLGKEYVLRQKQIAIVADLKNKLNEIRANNDLDTQRLERDVLEVENRISRSEGKQTDVTKLLSDLLLTPTPSVQYNEILFRLGESLQYLKEANTYLKQILLFIKTG